MRTAKPYIIIVAGIPASGKSVYGQHIAKKLSVPLVEKNPIREILYDVLHNDTIASEDSPLYGRASFTVTSHIAECLMKAGTSFVLEGNFSPAAAKVLSPMIEAYGYRPLTLLFDADMEVLHRRFCEREETDEPHLGLIMKNGAFSDLDYFERALGGARDFSIGEKILVDTSDFSTVSYDDIDRAVINFIGGGHADES